MNYDKAPFPWFGGKSRAAETVWALLGDVPHYVEPFAGALGVLLNRPHPCNRPYYSETVNDLDGFAVNAWRAIQWHPDEVAAAASWPVAEADKTARQIAVLKWRTDRTLDLLAGDPTWCDPVIAGWWLWGVSVQIGAIGGPWTSDPATGRIIKQNHRDPLREPGVTRDLPHLSDDGRGVNHAGTREPGVTRDPLIVFDSDQPDNPYHPWTMPKLTEWMRHLSARLRHVRILNGQWHRLVTSGAAWTLPVRQGNGPAGVFLDPPYDNNERASGLYGDHDDGSVAADCLEWCMNLDPADPRWRVVLAGYDTEHSALKEREWTVHEWFTPGHLTGGMGNLDGTSQQHRERLWASPQCLTDVPHEQLGLFQS